MMKSRAKILIAGFGYVGKALGLHFIRQGHEVWGLRRTAGAAQEMEAIGVRPLIADLTDPGSLKHLPNVEWVIAAHAPKPGEDYGATYVKGTRHLLSALAPHSPQRFVWISSTSVYGQTHGGWVDEQTPPEASTSQARLLLEAEAFVLARAFYSMILRLGGIYGPGRDRLSLLREGAVAMDSAAYINQIHVEDIVGMTACLLERGIDKQIYLGVDDEPVVRCEFYAWLAQRSGVRIPEVVSTERTRAITNKRCSNKKIKALGYTLKYPNYRVGFEPLIQRGIADDPATRRRE